MNLTMLSLSALIDVWRVEEMLVVHYKSLPTSSLARPGAETLANGGLVDLRLCLLSSSAEESAILRRLSAGGETEEVLRLLLAAGAYLSMERCLFLSLCRTGVGLLLRGAVTGESRSMLTLRLRMGLRRSP